MNDKAKLKKDLIRLTQDRRLYNCPIPIIGLTGGIATGKTTVSNLFKSNGLKVICADALIKKIYNNKTTVGFVSDNFPECIEDNQILFKSLRERLFANSNELQKMEQYLYPSLELKFNNELSSMGDISFVIYDVPLLFEKELHLKVDLSICVYIPYEMQLERVIARDNISKELAKTILAQQISIEEKKERAHLILYNDKDITHIQAQVDELISTYLK